MDKIYASFTNADDFRTFLDHADFEPVYEYNPFEFAKIHREEMGRLKLRSFNLHLLLDSGINKSCPWCDHQEPIIKYEEPTSQDSCKTHSYHRLYAQCPSCLARGPTLNIHHDVGYNKEAVEEYKSMVLQRWASRKVKKMRNRNEV